MKMLIFIAAFLVAIGILVAVHEFGHYWVAKKLGFKVLRFSIGFGKPLLTRIGKDADRTGALFITVDPERDTPASLKDYLSNFDPHLRGLTGDPAAVNAAIKAYRVYAKKVPLDNGDYTMDHTAVVYLMDKDGHFVAPFNLKQSADDAAAQIRRYL